MWFFSKTKKINSNINVNISIGKREGHIALFSGGVTQSGGELNAMWNSVSKRIKKDNPTAKNCLVLGVAGGTFIDTITKSFPKMKVTGIEIDEAMITAYDEYFRKNNINLKLINADAITWIEKSEKKFDIILVDLYLGRFNPEKARSKVFLHSLSKHLTKQGLIAYNSHFNKKNIKEFNDFVKLSETFFNTEIIYEFPLNKIILFTQRVKTSRSLKN